MSASATARAQAGHRRLDEAAKALKRAERAIKEAVRVVRQTQAELIGIEVTTTQPGGTVGNHQNEDAPEGHSSCGA